MSDIAIRVEGLGKKYRIGGRKAPYRTFQETLLQAAAAPFQRVKRLLRGESGGARELNEDFWALKDISFEIEKGEAIGVIGRNGAGKSTLLKLLSRITDPTTGSIDLYGRVGSLLEVGTGFHPELTGRENIYLNGAILGMKRAEITRKFDEIVDFAEIEKFIDTPVKYYSSGMYVRLAFAVAAHMETEILLVDEVLSVGDAAFQKKSLGKMDNVARGGRTVLFVSHNMATIESLCERTILLEKGGLAAEGPTRQVLDAYFRQTSEHFRENTTDLTLHPSRRPGSVPILREIHIFAGEHESTSVRMGGDLTIKVLFKHEELITNMRFGISVEDFSGQRLLVFSPTLHAPDLIQVPLREGTIECYIPKLRLLSGMYYITLILGNGTKDLDRIDRAVQFTVEKSDVYGSGYAPEPHHGIYYQEAEWKI